MLVDAFSRLLRTNFHKNFPLPNAYFRKQSIADDEFWRSGLRRSNEISKRLVKHAALRTSFSMKKDKINTHSVFSIAYPSSEAGRDEKVHAKKQSRPIQTASKK